MDDIIKDLNTLKDEIATSKEKLSKLKGREEELMKRLKTDFNLTSLEAAQKKISKDTNQLEKIRREIETEYKKLKEQFEW